MVYIYALYIDISNETIAGHVNYIQDHEIDKFFAIKTSNSV